MIESESVGGRRYAPSIYNILTRLGNERTLAFNSASGASAIWSQEESTWIAAGCQGDPGFRKAMVYGGFAVPEGTDELGELRREYEEKRGGAGRLGLTIAPTLACNFGCDYCFQGEHKPAGRMGLDVQDAVMDLVRASLPRVRGLSVCWYGGEPLLGLDVVERLSVRLLDGTRAAGVSYSASMVSNGFRLNSDVARRLADLQVNTVQVTIDGGKDWHDRRRVLLSGAPTFERILENLRAVVDAEQRLRIALRVNVDLRNRKGVIPLLDSLVEGGLSRRPNLSVYFAPVESITEGCHAISAFALERSNYSQLETDLIRAAWERGLCSRPYPVSFPGVCGAVRPNDLVILPDGDLHKCWDTVSDTAQRIGNLLHRVPDDATNRARWSNWSPFDNENCRTCRLLPVCGGGCAHKHVNPEAVAGHARTPCPSWKFDFKRRILQSALMQQGLTAADLAGANTHLEPLELQTFRGPERTCES